MTQRVKTGIMRKDRLDPNGIVNPKRKENNMNKQIKKDYRKQEVRGAKKSGIWLWVMCITCIVVLFGGCCFLFASRVSNDEMNALKAELSNEIATLKNTEQELQQTIASLNNSQAAAQQEINSLKNSNQAAQQGIASLKNANQAAQQEINSLKNSNQAAQQEIDALENRYQAAQGEINQLRTQVQDLLNRIPSDKIKIYIDQGHNPSSYHNAGAAGNGLHEEDLTFTIGCLLADLLREDGRFEICLSRPTADTVLGTDNSSSLAARVEGAEAFGAQYFISLHTNSFSSESANGIEVFVAEQESTSYAFGNSLLQGLLDSTNLNNRGMKLNPDLYVLKKATMPAALLEMGFISNVGDSTLLSQNPELFAEGIYNGILAYFELQ